MLLKKTSTLALIGALAGLVWIGGISGCDDNASLPIVPSGGQSAPQINGLRATLVNGPLPSGQGSNAPVFDSSAYQSAGGAATIMFTTPALVDHILLTTQEQRWTSYYDIDLTGVGLGGITTRRLQSIVYNYTLQISLPPGVTQTTFIMVTETGGVFSPPVSFTVTGAGTTTGATTAGITTGTTGIGATTGTTGIGATTGTTGIGATTGSSSAGATIGATTGVTLGTSGGICPPGTIPITTFPTGAVQCLPITR